MADDNVMAALAGGVGGLANVADLVLKYSLENKYRKKRDLISYEDIPKQVADQLGLQPGQTIDINVVPLLKRTLRYDEQGDLVDDSILRSQVIGKPPSSPAETALDSPELSIEEKERQRILGRKKGELDAAKPEAKVKTIDFLDDIERIKKTAKELLNHPGKQTGTGILGAIGRRINQTDAKAYNELLKTFKAQVGVVTTKKLKELSRTGATGFGNISNADREAFENNYGALQSVQSGPDVDSQVKKVFETFDMFQKRGAEGWKIKYGEELGWKPFSEEQSKVKTSDEILATYLK